MVIFTGIQFIGIEEGEKKKKNQTKKKMLLLALD